MSPFFLPLPFFGNFIARRRCLSLTANKRGHCCKLLNVTEGPTDKRTLLNVILEISQSCLKMLLEIININHSMGHKFAFSCPFFMRLFCFFDLLFIYLFNPEINN